VTTVTVMLAAVVMATSVVGDIQILWLMISQPPLIQSPNQRHQRRLVIGRWRRRSRRTASLQQERCRAEGYAIDGGE
jgi:hypothetical protein